MNTLKKIAVGASLMLAACASFAQRGIDIFEATRTIDVAPAQNLIGWNSGIVTNQPALIIGAVGAAKLDIIAETNVGTAGGTMTVTPQVSSDTTNWATLTNYALITAPTSVISTNNYYGSPGIQSTNFVMIPGVQTTPNAATAGFSTPYLAELGGGTAAYTNGGAITLTAGVHEEVGFLIQEQPRYWRLIYTPGGSATNWTFGPASITTAVRKL